ncbi:MAG TPA: sensor histidine kinase [Chitinophagaceae bacterium]|jgi:signal transduction histidine kinase|nr:sensor histidine kinase [Chitinophagaceae bacterium]
MKRIKRVFLGVQTGLWILFTLLMALQLSQETAHWETLTAGVVATCLYVFYGHRILMIRYPGRKRYGAYLLWLAALVATGPSFYLLFHYRRFATWDLFSEYYIISVFSVVLPFVFLSWLARVTENLVINTFKKEQLEKQAVESELHYLKSQINPHFLFNTLNNIHTLAYKQAPTAPQAITRLASLMRYMIYESNAPTVPLSREMEYLQDYVSLQQLRYKEKGVADVRIEGAAEACTIAPLLFIHLLENAYKHSPAGLRPGDLKVRVEVQDGVLTFSVQNPVGARRAPAFDEPGGIGLPNVRKRLALLYPGQHTLDIHPAAGTFTVVLTIHGLQSPLHEAKAHLLYH